MKNIFKRKLPESIFTELEEPIRAEIFGTARLEGHAQSLALAQRVTADPRQGRNLSDRIAENRRVLSQGYHVIIEAVESKRAITPAAEWLIDNFHIVRAQLKDIHDHLPPEYYKLLPKIAEGPLAGYPRVYGIAWAFVAHTDSHLDLDLLKTFLTAYQKVQPLTIGELWAIPITLRIVLVENLRRLTARIVGSQISRFHADQIADSILGLGEQKPKSVAQVIHSLENKKLSRAFAVQLLQRLRFQEDRVGPLLQYIEKRLSLENHLIEDWVSQEHVSQSAANITVRNIITSARLMSAYSWPDFFEDSSIVDKILRDGSDFALMDFTTRDRYRHRIEELARRSKLDEIAVAKKVIEMCQTASIASKADTADTKQISAATMPQTLASTTSAAAVPHEPGYFLIGDGRREFENVIQYKPNPKTVLRRWYKRKRTRLHLGSILVLTLLISWLTINGLSNAQNFTSAHFAGPLLLTFICVLLLSSEIAIAIVNRWTVAFLGPRHLPRLNFEKGLRSDLKTFVVIPTMLTDVSKIREQLEQIEVHYLSNQDDNLYLALLTDFADSKFEQTKEDELLIEIAFKELRLLNERYPTEPDAHPRFSIYHRRRLYNSQEDRWMGWERKRGKLHEFNRLLMGATDTSYFPFAGQEIRVPKDIRYVITLDADTKLPRSAVAQLVGTMAHPLNLPKYDENKGRVVSGYGILQPRITPSLPSESERTTFRKLSTVRSGIDPYASAVSDIYQDLFDEGSFTGKGIYDFRIFEKVLGHKIPENTVLSHDLLEGNFVRCGFLSDVDFFEDFPSHTGVAALRNHRWTRGDWQLLPWIFGKRGRTISAINRWKMIDNLRRSLVAPAAFVLFFASFIFYRTQFLSLPKLVLLTLLTPALITLWADLWPRRRNSSQWLHLVYTFHEFSIGVERALMNLILLPQAAWVSIDAISRSLYRMFISRKKMLEWTTAAQAKASAGSNLSSFYRSMRGPLALSLVASFVFFLEQPQLFLYALPLLLLWIFSPAMAYAFSRPPRKRITHPVQPQDLVLFQSTARRIWRFFATFVNENENFLPPDNFQEDPVAVVAHRSSPTNFGLYLLSILAARDFGWIGVNETVERLDQTLKSLLKLERYEGHFLNWYDTVTGKPLEPRYISSVDNGNLTGHLVAVAQGCDEILNSSVDFKAFHLGVIDTLTILDEEINNYKYAHLTANEDFDRVRSAYLELVERINMREGLVENRTQHFIQLKSQAALLVKYARTFAGDPVAPEKEEILAWCRALQNDIQSYAQDFLSLQSWSDFADEIMSTDAEAENRHRWEGLRQMLNDQVPLKDMDRFCKLMLNELINLKKREKAARHKLPDFIDPLLETLEQASEKATQLIQKIKEAQKTCQKLIREMNFNLLYDKNRKLFSIGMRVQERQLDPSYYDLLASEARLTSFIAIAKGDVPVSHWFHLGRSLVNAGSSTALVSWSGSMFEYLMPCIVMRSPNGSLLEETCRNAVLRQIEYGKEKNVPWGISESAYHKRDLELTYQYSNFGVPDLGLKRGLSADLVIAPYATILAALFEPALAAENLRALKLQGAQGPYGFYEAVDYTPSRLPSGKGSVTVKTYMAHHQGMALVALANIFKNSGMQNRFHANPTVQATELLLQERTPHTIGTLPTAEENLQISFVKEEVEHVSRLYHSVNRPVPTTQLISNGNYTVMLTSAGSGYSRIRDLAVTRFREDVTRDHYGSFIYLKDCESQEVWSAGYQPVCVEADHYEVSFAEDRVRFKRQDFNISSVLEIFVSPEENAEIRRISLTNTGTTVREIEITSYLEVVLNSQNADVAHPAFSNLFIETEFIKESSTLIASRRPRSNKDKKLWMMHLLRGDRYTTGPIQYETDRSEFIGRGRTVANPAALFEKEKLSGTSGPVLDPILSLRTRVRLEPGTMTHLTFVNAVSEDRNSLEMMVDKFSDPSSFERASELAWTQAQVKLHYLGIEPDEAHLFQRLTTRLLYSDPSLRAPTEVLKRNVRDLTGLWSLGISGDHPIILVRIDDIEDRSLIRQLLKAQSYFSTKGFIFDLVILNEKASSYSQELQAALEQMAQAAYTRSSLSPTHGKVFVLRNEHLSDADQTMLASEARVILSSRSGSLSDQVKRTFLIPQTAATIPSRRTTGQFQLPVPELEFFNGTGGFSKNGTEYTVVLKDRDTTPAPWINVIANPEFGFQVSESGSGYTWSLNSRENQLTPWSNDPVCDPAGEAFFISDVDSGVVWSPTAAPIRLATSTYLAHHGQGYSRFETSAYGIRSELIQFVAPDAPVKISRIILENKSHTVRKLAITSYTEWVLGFSRATMAPTTVTEFDEESKTIFAWNARNSEHGKRIAFAAVVGDLKTFTCDRTEFIGRNSSLNKPAALFINETLKESHGGGFDPCAALQTQVELQPGEQIEVSFLLGQSKNRTTAREIIEKIRKSNLEEKFLSVQTRWNELLEKVQVETPDRSFDLVLNRWYLYQTIVCRLWARAAFYQAGGAFGFRDQLQDVMAVLMAAPQLAREQIIRAASRQFVEGDVQHWWHPPFGRGVRTHFSDDLLWLPYVVSQYLSVTKDYSILDEEASFLVGPPLRKDQEDSYYTPEISPEKASIYEHCVRALNHSLKTGAHGLPLMGSGDWNDGMNHVGLGGKGESVWLAWFLYSNLKSFSTLAKERGEYDRQSHYAQHAKKLAEAIEKNAWDGNWYRRAYFDDGHPLGSKTNEECQIDSLAQSWAVISGAADPARAKEAMESVFEHLVKTNDEMILLFNPPFDKTKLDPGYIKGYLPGVRENGGQYTHAASWVVIATAMLGDGKQAHELFSFINPIHHGRKPQDVKRYKIEPYVLAGDVYSQNPHTGRGGWSWYTGAAGWMYRAGIESILGLQIKGTELTIKPCVPPDWKDFKIRYRFGKSVYTFEIQMTEGAPDSAKFSLVDDGKNHTIVCKISSPAETITPRNSATKIEDATTSL